MSVELLDKTRKINSLLQNNQEGKVKFTQFCDILSEILESNALVISKKGKVLGLGFCEEVHKLTNLLKNEEGEFIDGKLNTRLQSILSTKENVNLETLGFHHMESVGVRGMVTPIEISGERLGTLFLYKEGDEYSIDDIILCEYGATIVGLEMLRSVHEEYEEEKRKEQVLMAALATLSMSEIQAVTHIFDELEGNEGILVASKIADRVGITRSVIVNALRKLESAGIIESRSSGMKGTYIKIINENIIRALQDFKEKHK